MLNDASLAKFKASLHGELLQPHDAGYDAARHVYNGMVDKHPRLIAQCISAADVAAAVNFGRDNDLLLAVRGGGHNGAGLGTCDGGLLIDLSLMKGIRVNPAAREVRIEGGCTQGNVEHATHEFGLTVPAGIISTTGIAGLTLGGGHGYLARKFGLTIDNLLEASVVLADGRFVTANMQEHDDLFWAIRGGGGNYGVVTSFLFRAHPVNTVVAGPMLWPLDEAAEVLQWYRDFMIAAPLELYGFFAFLEVPPFPPFPEPLHGKTMCGIVWCYTGSVETTETAFRPVFEFRRPAFEHVGPMPFPALQSLFDPLLPSGLQWYWKGDFVTELSDEAITQHIRFGSQLPTPLSTMHLYPIDGAVNQVARDATAFSYREAKWSMVIAGIDPHPANREKITAWAKAYWTALHPYCAGGAYVNFMMEEGVDRVRATYRDNYDRLVAVKRQYDPSNLFRVNQNINPEL